MNNSEIKSIIEQRNMYFCENLCTYKNVDLDKEPCTHFPVDDFIDDLYHINWDAPVPVKFNVALESNKRVNIDSDFIKKIIKNAKTYCSLTKDNNAHADIEFMNDMINGKYKFIHNVIGLMSSYCTPVEIQELFATTDWYIEK